MNHSTLCSILVVRLMNDLSWTQWRLTPLRPSTQMNVFSVQVHQICTRWVLTSEYHILFPSRERFSFKTEREIRLGKPVPIVKCTHVALLRASQLTDSYGDPPGTERCRDR